MEGGALVAEAGPVSELMESASMWPERHVVANDGSVYPFPPADHTQKIKRRKRSSTPRRKVRAIVKRWGWGCHYCGKNLEHAKRSEQTVDHVVPRSRDGSNKMSNLVMACPGCNTTKGDQTPTEWLGKPCCERHA